MENKAYPEIVNWHIADSDQLRTTRKARYKKPKNLFEGIGKLPRQPGLEGPRFMQGGKLDKVSPTFTLLLFSRRFSFVSGVGRKVGKLSRKLPTGRDSK